MKKKAERLPAPLQFVLCLCLPVAIASITYFSGQPTDLVVLKTVISALYLPVAIGLEHSGFSMQPPRLESWRETLVRGFVESLMLAAWLTAFMWKPGLPLENSLKTFGVLFGLYFGVILLSRNIRRIH